MSDSDGAKRETEPPKSATERWAGEIPGDSVPARRSAEPPSAFVQILGAVAIALLAVVAAQGFLTARDVKLTSQSMAALAGRLEAQTERAGKLFEEVVILRGQVGELKNFLQVSGRGGGGAGGGDRPPGPRDWTGVYVSELAPLLPILAQYQGDMGEAWIYTDNETFIESIARALENMEGGVEVEVEQPQ